MLSTIILSISLLVSATSLSAGGLVLTHSAPDISGIGAKDWDLHPSLGVVVTLGDKEVAYPIKNYMRVAKCSFIVDKDTFLLTYRVCGGTLILTLGEPTMWRHKGESWGISMDKWEN